MDDILFSEAENTPTFHFTAEDLEFIKSGCNGRSPSEKELDIYGSLLEHRRTLAEGYAVSGLESDSLSLKQTYKDMLQKSEAIYGSRSMCGGLEASAHICSEYMRYIGRYDGDTRITAGAIPDSRAFVIGEGKTALSFGGKPRASKPQKPIKQRLAIILLDGEDYEASVRSLFSDSCARTLCTRIIRIEGYGMIGAVAELCVGVRMDQDRISRGTAPWQTLTKKYIGRHLVLCPTENAQSLCTVAKEHGLHATHFAFTDSKSRKITANGFELSTSVIRSLIYGKQPTVVTLPVPELSKRTAERSITVRQEGESRRHSIGTAIKAQGSIFAPVCICPETNAYADAVNALTDSILILLASGVDRRAVCSALCYELPKGDVSPEAMGEDMGLILGVYRVAVELAPSEGLTRVIYGKERTLSGALYATVPRKPVGDKFKEDGSYLALLTLGTDSEGMYSFSELRRMCDTFCDLYRDGRVLSAVAVRSSLYDAIDSLGGEMTAELSDNGRLIGDASLKGILFEVRDKKGLNIIGRVMTPEQKKPDLSE